MSDDVEMTYFAKFKLDAQEFLGGLNSAQSGILAFYRDVTVSLNMTAQLFDRVIAEVQKFGQTAQELKDFSYQTGLSTDKIQQLQYAAVLAGTNFGTVSVSINRLSLAIDEAKDSSSEAAKSFSRINVTTSGKTVDQVFDDTAASLVNMRDVTERNRIANDLFGRSYKDLLPYLDTYISKQKEISEHPGLSKEEIDQLEDAKVAWDRLSSSFTIYSGKVLAFVEGSAWRKLTESHTALPDAVKSKMTAMEEANYEVYGIIPERFQSLVAETLSKPYVSTQSQSGAVSELTDKYAGLTDTEIDLLDVNDALTKAEEDQIAALKSGDVEAYNTASRAVQTYKNRIQELTQARLDDKTASEELTGPTYNSTFASSLANGAVGPDTAGYSDLASMTAEQLQEVVAKGNAGGSKAMAEKAAMYLSPMKSGSGAGTGAAAAKTATPGSADQTASLKTELEKQTDLWKTQNTNITDGWATLEKSALTHYTALAELSRIRAQAELDYMAQCVNFAGENPIVQNKIIMSATGADWEPPTFTAISAPSLSSANFESVKFLTSSSDKAGSSDNKGNTTVQVKITNTSDIQSVVKAKQDNAAVSVLSQTGGT